MFKSEKPVRFLSFFVLHEGQVHELVVRTELCVPLTSISNKRIFLIFFISSLFLILTFYVLFVSLLHFAWTRPMFLSLPCFACF